MRNSKYEQSSEVTERVLDRIQYDLVNKTPEVQEQVMYLLRQYPQHFIPGFFESHAVQAFHDSNVIVAFDGDNAVGCLMYDPGEHEFSFLATDPRLGDAKSKLAEELFRRLSSTIPKGTKVHLLVNTEDASIPGHDVKIGEAFAPARRLYERMGLELKPENVIKDAYGPGQHVYKVEWIV